MMAYKPPRPRWLPLPQPRTGHLNIALQDNAGPEDILTAILQAALTRTALATSAQPQCKGSVEAQRKALRELKRQGLGPDPGIVEAAMAKSRVEARAKARRLLKQLKDNDWRAWPFTLSSTERAPYVYTGGIGKLHWSQ